MKWRFDCRLFTIYLCFCQSTSTAFISFFRSQHRRGLGHHGLYASAFTATAQKCQIGSYHVSYHELNETQSLIVLSSPRAWLEYLESEQGLAGVYTVMRVDATLNCLNSTSGVCCPQHTIWGEHYHLHRLSSSFVLNFSPKVDLQSIVDAEISSSMVISTLIPLIQKTLWNGHRDETIEDGVQVLILTLLWIPPLGTNVGPIEVRGHICSFNDVVQPQNYDPPAIKTVIALPAESSIHWDRDDRLSWSQLPNRIQHHPELKMSSWCRERRSLENIFKPSDVGEVIMVLPRQDGDWEILEGLTSNAFVLYSDGTLRTCGKGVLDGYAKNMVQEAADRCNITISHLPITLQDAFNGCWIEVFLTSAIRIIIPVNEILIPDYGLNDVPRITDDMKFTRLWISDYPVDGSKRSRLWNKIYLEILQNRSMIRPKPSLNENSLE
jgi:hypothetical protein